jgi:hypothetical protein
MTVLNGFSDKISEDTQINIESNKQLLYPEFYWFLFYNHIQAAQQYDFQPVCHSIELIVFLLFKKDYQ